jgi:hypothetical protein
MEAKETFLVSGQLGLANQVELFREAMVLLVY